MELVIGGSFQGKLEYAKQKLQKGGVCADEIEIADGETIKIEEIGTVGCRIFNRLHLLIKRYAESGRTEEIPELLERFLEYHPRCVIICDEVGYGVVPACRNERVYREEVGRALCFLTGHAESVERIVGGIAMRIK